MSATCSDAAQPSLSASGLIHVVKGRADHASGTMFCPPFLNNIAVGDRIMFTFEGGLFNLFTVSLEAPCGIISHIPKTSDYVQLYNVTSNDSVYFIACPASTSCWCDNIRFPLNAGELSSEFLTEFPSMKHVLGTVTDTVTTTFITVVSVS